MNARQKQLVVHIIAVMVFTIVMVVGFANIKNLINRSEAMRTMKMVGSEISRYRKNYGSLPLGSFVKQYAEQIGAVRLTNLVYRAQWIEFGFDPNSTILAYSEKRYSGFVRPGCVVLWLNGNVEWMSKKQFEKTLATQQKQQELQWIKEHLQSSENQP